jgi:hypothetical protein
MTSRVAMVSLERARELGDAIPAWHAWRSAN